MKLLLCVLFCASAIGADSLSRIGGQRGGASPRFTGPPKQKQIAAPKITPPYTTNAPATNISVVELLIGTNVYRNATIRKSGAESAIVRHDGGFFSTAITNLPEPHLSTLLNTNEVAEAIRKRDEAREREDARVKNFTAAQRRALGVEIDGRLYAKSSLEELRVMVKRVEAGAVHGQFVKAVPYYSGNPGMINDTQRAGGYVAWTPSRTPSGYDRYYTHQVMVRNAPRDAVIGKEMKLMAKKVGVINGIETWDCGTIPR